MRDSKKALLVEQIAFAVQQEMARRLLVLEQENDRLRGEIRQVHIALERYANSASHTR